MTSNLNAPHFKDAEKARAWLERRVWPNGPVCPHCGVIGEHYLLQGATTRPGLYKCFACRETFTVTVGTVFERSKIPLNVWLQATYLLCSSKKGMSSHQLHRTLGVTYKTAWFMSHRIREAMKTTAPIDPMGGSGKTVEADETYFGTEEGKTRGKQGPNAMNKIFSLVERGGQVRSFHVADVTGKNLKAILLKQVYAETKLMTDSAPRYNAIGNAFKSHDIVNHSDGEYVRNEGGFKITTNTIESYFALLKRGLIGTYHNVSSAHLHRYTNEFDFRYNNRIKLGIDDVQRTEQALKGIQGKRLTYRRPSGAQPKGPSATSLDSHTA